MERLQHLISKLKEQFEQNAAPAQMLTTVQLIEAELTKQVGPASIRPGSTKVAVVMPSLQKRNQETLPVASEQAKEMDRSSTMEKSLAIPPQATKEERDSWILFPLSEVPTLSHQQAVKEINDVIGSNGASVNDKLKENILELAATLKDAPVRELKKAIGVNDRYVFINELFRGDEVMYERSIKTINNFRILPEAEYWMERELKIKLGWDDSRDIVKHFYQLVKRRFS